MKRCFGFIILFIGISCTASYSLPINQIEYDEVNDKIARNSTLDNPTVETEIKRDITVSRALIQGRKTGQGKILPFGGMQSMLLPAVFMFGVTGAVLLALVGISLKSLLIGVALLVFKAGTVLSALSNVTSATSSTSSSSPTAPSISLPSTFSWPSSSSPPWSSSWSSPWSSSWSPPWSSSWSPPWSSSSWSSPWSSSWSSHSSPHSSWSSHSSHSSPHSSWSSHPTGPSSSHSSSHSSPSHSHSSSSSQPVHIHVHNLDDRHGKSSSKNGNTKVSTVWTSSPSSH